MGGGSKVAEYYEKKAEQCLRLVRECIDAVAIAALRKLAAEYLAMAEAIRSKETDDPTDPEV